MVPMALAAGNVFADDLSTRQVGKPVGQYQPQVTRTHFPDHHAELVATANPKKNKKKMSLLLIALLASIGSEGAAAKIGGLGALQ